MSYVNTTLTLRGILSLYIVYILYRLYSSTYYIWIYSFFIVKPHRIKLHNLSFIVELHKIKKEPN